MSKGENPKLLGETIYQAREAKGLTSPQLAKLVGLHEATIRRLQLGEIMQPGPGVLARIAEVLDLNVGELYALAGYQAEHELPDLKGWLNIKHRDLPDAAIEALQSHLDYLVDKHEPERRKEAA